MKKKVAIILAGSGVYDGSEIHETTLTLYALSKRQIPYEIFAPDQDQHHVINHLTGDEMNEKRNVLVEAARIARGKIKELDEFEEKDFDALIIPGGFGVAKNLATFAFEGVDFTINPLVEKALKSMVAAGKPVGALCISPVLVAKLFDGVKLTIGLDEATIQAVEKLGAKHTKTHDIEVVVDEKYKIITTPCYMLDLTVTQIAKATDQVVETLAEMM